MIGRFGKGEQGSGQLCQAKPQVAQAWYACQSPQNDKNPQL